MKKNVVYSLIIVFINTIYPLAVFPYVSRILGATGLGTYNYYSLLFSYLFLFSNFGISLFGSKEIGKYRDNIIKRNQTIVELIVLNLINSFILYFSIVIPLYIFSSPRDSLIILIFSVTLISNAISGEWFYVAVERQKFILIRNIIIKISSLFFIYTLVKNETDLFVYILIVIIGLVLSSTLNFIFLFKEIEIKKIRRLNLIQYLNPLFGIFIIEISVRYFGMADVAILESFVTRQQVGYFTFALSIYNIISSFLKVLATTLLPRSSYYIEKNEHLKFSSLIKDTISLVFFIGIPSIVFLILWSDKIVFLLGGDKFMPSIIILQTFSILIVISSVINLFVFQLLYPLNKLKSIVISYFTGIIINIIINFVFIHYFSYITVVISSIISHIVILLMLLIFEKKVINKSIFSSDVVKYIFSGLIMFAISFLLINFKLDKFNFIPLLIGCILYIAIVLLLKDNLLRKNISNLKKIYEQKS